MLFEFSFNYIIQSDNDISGWFWQLTDIHYDANYSLSSKDLQICQDGRGKFGEYPCDAPWPLVLSALDMMVKTKPDPDFILWTGYEYNIYILNKFIFWFYSLISSLFGTALYQGF